MGCTHNHMMQGHILHISGRMQKKSNSGYLCGGDSVARNEASYFAVLHLL